MNGDAALNQLVGKTLGNGGGNGQAKGGSKGGSGGSASAVQDPFESVQSVAPVGAESGLDAKTSEDYWSPQCPPSPPFKDDYGAITPLPSHDGTDCLKWDESLRTHTEHFKVAFCAFSTSR